MNFIIIYMMMTHFSSRAELRNFKYAIKIVGDCRDNWLQDQFPNIGQLLYDYGLIDIPGKIQDFKSYYQFRDALNYLTDYEFIRILIDSRSITRIYKGKQNIPTNFTFEDYLSRNL